MTPYPMDPTEAVGPMRLVLCAFPDRAAAERVSRVALERRLAACANLWPISSRYWWKGMIESTDEVLVIYKTAPKRVGALFEHLASSHPYDVPEIVEIDVGRVHRPYLAYLAGTIDPDAPPPPLGGGDPHPRRSAGPRARAVRPPGRTRAPPHRRSKHIGRPAR
jgi:periplasmic divalent cation tolerance protein